MRLHADGLLLLLALLLALFAACLVACSMDAGGPSSMVPVPCGLTEDEWEEVHAMADRKFDKGRIEQVTITFSDSGDTCEAWPRW